MSIEAAIRDEFRARHRARVDFAKLDAELRDDNAAFTNLRVNFHEIEFECDQHLAMWHRLNPVYQRAIVTMSFYIGIDAVIALGVHRACQAGRMEAAALAVEAADVANRCPAAAKRVAEMFRT